MESTIKHGKAKLILISCLGFREIMVHRLSNFNTSELHTNFILFLLQGGPLLVIHRLLPQ